MYLFLDLNRLKITKNIIVKNIFRDSEISKQDSKKFLDSFLNIFLLESSNKKIKISGFGTFAYKPSPQRWGRNPKTNKFYIINARKRLTLKVSNKLKLF